MKRRSFLGSLAAGGSCLALPFAARAEHPLPVTLLATQAEQSEAIQVAATRLLRTLAPSRRDQISFPFPKGATPTPIGFGPMPGGPAGPGTNRPHHDVSFDTDGKPKSGSPGDPPSAGPHHGPPPPAGEKFGQAIWTNFPVGIVARPGVRMGDFTTPERDAVHALLQTVLSPMGYRKILAIMQADQKVADAGADYAAGLDVYTIGLFGTPSTSDPWMLQFGGHHLGLNVTFVGENAVCSPLHTGILPARFEENSKIIRGLGAENDKAFDLLATLTPDQRKAAVIDHDISDLVFGPGRPDAKLAPQGLSGATMTEEQRTGLFSLITEWAGMLNDSHTAPRLADIRNALPDTRFAWSGPTAHEPGINGEAYFRIHGPNLIIEHAPQPSQGGYKVHVHTIMRDLGNDYAKQLV